ncbi:PLP-dependent cysteine synthase family protein [Amycolatopsis nigrescens]|uniref:PLP-dependent cysteine synthase family protein n=1 Tax=Amycolatopsis nigrescens TaxID=381445 RepID=UPI0003A14FFA|nr:cysteine synthase family protein [Amycolatopsis nigrescens]
MICDSVLDTIGRTPVVRLRRVTVPNGSEILVKLEAFNPGGSIKDRAVLSMVTHAERDGRLQPGGTIVESTSGNVGKALALIGAVRGYRVILVVDPKAPASMLKYVSALGAEIVLVDTPDAQGWYQGPRIERVKQLVSVIPDSFWPDQYNNPDNPRAHAEHTGRELLGDVPRFDALVTAVGTGGHISGTSATVKRALPNVVTIGVDAKNSATFGHPFSEWSDGGPSRIRGLGLMWQPGCLDRSVVDRVQLVADHEGIATTRLLATEEGVLVGESAGAAVFGALHHAHENPGSRIVVIAPDDGANYLGETFDDGWLATRGLLEPIENAGLTTVDGLLTAASLPTCPAVALADVVEEQLVQSG